MLIKLKQNRETKSQERYFVVLNSQNGYVDRGFQQSGIFGICDYLKIPVDETNQCNRKNSLFIKKAGFGFPNTIIDPKKIYIYIKNQISKNPKKQNVFILPGFTFSNFLTRFLENFDAKKTFFISIDTFYNKKPWPKNLFQFGFNQQYSGYNAGLYVAIQALLYPEKFKDGDLQKSGKQIKFAAVGGMKIPAIAAYALGFKAAIQTVNDYRLPILNFIKRQQSDPKIKKFFQNRLINPEQAPELIFEKVSIVGGFDPQIKSSETRHLTQTLFQKHRVSVVFSIAVSLTFTMQRVAKEQNHKERSAQNWIVGVDNDQSFSLENQMDLVTQKTSDSIFLVSATINLQTLISKILNKIEKKEFATKNNKIGSFEKDQELVQIPKRYRNSQNSVWVVLEKLAKYDFENKKSKTINVTKNFEDWLLTKLINLSESSKLNPPIWKFLNSPNQNLNDLKIQLNLKNK